MITEALWVLGLGLIGLLLWRRWAPGLQRLRTEETTAVGGRFFVAAFLLELVVALYVLPLGGARPGHLRDLLLWSMVAAIAGLALAASRFARGEGSLSRLGLHAQRGPSALLVAASAWLAFLPLLTVVGLANEALLRALGIPDELQEPLRLFLEDATARRSPLVWLAVVLVLPACEELLFRGALYAALRRALHPALAMALSAVLFGLVHEPSALLPTAVLGAALAWLYERTGSLAAPIAFHALHNGLTLLAATLAPEILTA